MKKLPRQRKPTPKKPPKFSRHTTGQAYSIWPAGTPYAGDFRYHGLHGTPEADENYRRWLQEIQPGGGVPPRQPGEVPLWTVAEVWDAWLSHLEKTQRYKKHGRETGAMRSVVVAMKAHTGLYGSLLARDFGPYELAQVRASLVAGNSKRGRPRQRDTVNRYIRIIRQAWAWATADGKVPRESWLSLSAVTPLRVNEGGREAGEVVSVREEVFSATLPHLQPAVRAMLELCSWSACRIGEAVQMRTADIVTEDPIVPDGRVGECWIYRPRSWKTEHQDRRKRSGRQRIVILGPQAQAVLEPWLKPWAPDDYLFDSHESLVLRQHKRHGTKPPPQTFGNHPYNPASICKIVQTCCKSHGIEHWHPHQLRHLAASRFAARYGLDLTRLLLGHSSLEITLRYVDPGVITPEDRRAYAALIAAVAQLG